MNTGAAFVGLNLSSRVSLADITNVKSVDVQDGSNRLTTDQTAAASTGDGVAGQVLGVVSAGAASLDATNTSSDSSVQTGDARATNDSSEFVGLNDANGNSGVTITDISSTTAANIQNGSNGKTLSQSASATSGSGVARR